MAEIKIDRNHTLGQAEAQKRVTDLAPKLKEKYGVELAWKGDGEAQVKGTGVTGTLRVAAEAVHIDLKLGLLLRPMAGKIRSALEHQIDKALT
jgi:putative polyhydroxyalkanoate system protein